MTIEERAREKYGDYTFYDVYKDIYIQGAEDQDPISRADERKRVIEKVLKYLHDTYELHLMPLFDEDFKKAMEE